MLTVDARDASVFEHALGMVFPWAQPESERLVMILDAYFDESGTHDQSGTVVVAGFISTPNYWKEFDCEWAAFLEEFGLDMFRMSKFNNQKGPFSGWSDERRRACTDRLFSVIKAHVIASVGVSFSRLAYDSLLNDRTKKVAINPYGLGVRLCLMNSANLIARCKSFEKSRIAYFFESGAEGMGSIAKQFKVLRRNKTRADLLRLNTLSFLPKQDFSPFQAADVLAYEIYKEHVRLTSSPDKFSRSHYLGPLWDCGMRDWTQYADDELGKLNEYLKHAPMP